MNAIGSRVSVACSDLARRVGAPCAITRVGEVYLGRRALTFPRVRGCWLRCPALGQPLWLLVGTSLVRTSRVMRIDTIRDRCVIRTRNGQYTFDFDPPDADQPAAPAPAGAN